MGLVIRTPIGSSSPATGDRQLPRARPAATNRLERHVAHDMVDWIRRAPVRVELCPNLHVIATHHISDAALMQMAGPHDARTPSPSIEKPIKRLPVIDERIDQDNPGGDRDSPPGDALLPTVLAAFVLRPLRMLRLEPPETFDNLANSAIGHGPKCRKGLIATVRAADQRCCCHVSRPGW